MQEVFGGALTSDVTCGECGEVSSTRDPLLDLSLELQARPPATPPARCRTPGPAATAGRRSRALHCHLDANVSSLRFQKD